MLISESAVNRPAAGAATIASPPEMGSIAAGTRSGRSQLHLSNVLRGKGVGPLLFLEIGDRRGVVSANAFSASALADGLVGVDRRRTQLVPIGKSGRLNDERPAVASGGGAVPSTRKAPGREGSDPGTTFAGASTLRREFDSRSAGRQRLKIREHREMDGKERRPSSDQRRILHEELRLLSPIGDVQRRRFRFGHIGRTATGTPPRHVANAAAITSAVRSGSSWNLPPAHEFEFDLGLPHSRVEGGLPHARRGAGTVGIE